MLKKKWLRIVGGVVLGGASMASAALYTWIADGTGDWSDQTQWSTAGSCLADCYPRTIADDAVIGKCVEVKLTESLDIDDLSLPGVTCGGEHPSEVTFTTDLQGAQTITALSISINSNTIIAEELAGLIAVGTDACATP